MNTIFIFFLGGLIIFLLFILMLDTEDPLTLKIYGVIIFVLFIAGLTLDIKSYKADYTHTKTATEYVVALNDNPGIKGSYYVRRGYIENQMYYNYMVRLSSNSYIANQIPVKKSTIYETDGDYRIEWWEKEKGYFMAKETEKYWKVYIPKNSILSEYDIDLQ